MQGDGGNISIDYVLAIYERLSLLLFVTEHHVVDSFRSQSPSIHLVYGDVQTTHRIVVYIRNTHPLIKTLLIAELQSFSSRKETADGDVL